MSSGLLQIYLCGAHSTGKTTLFNDLKPHLNLWFEEEVARRIIDNHGWTKDDFLPSVYPDRFVQLNKEILQTQITIESENTTKGREFICDREIDPIVYIELYVSTERSEIIRQDEGVRQWLKRMQKTIVFVLYPHEECIKEDDARLSPSIEELNTFTKRLEEVLERNKITFYRITSLDRTERVNEILEIIKIIKPSVLKYSY